MDHPAFALAWGQRTGVLRRRGAHRLVGADGLALQLARDENGGLLGRRTGSLMQKSEQTRMYTQ